MSTATYTSPTETSYYANHTTEALESIAAKYAADGMYIAANSGADHPLAIECAKIWAAVTAALLAR
jgi:hypothetical protein